MDIRVLKYFTVVADEKNISRAAEIIHITQPTLSRQLNQLEEELGCTLFTRGRNALLTPSGEILYRRAKEIISLSDRIPSEVSSGNKIQGKITISTGAFMSYIELAKVMSSYKTKYSDVTYDVTFSASDVAKKDVLNGTSDFALLLEPIDLDGLDYIRMPVREQFGLWMRRGAYLEHKDIITNNDVKNLKLILSTARPAIANELDSWMGQSLESCNIVTKTNLVTNNVAALVSLGDYYAFTLEGAVSYYDKEYFTFRKVFPEIYLTTALVWKKDAAMSPACSEFLENCKTMLVRHI